MTMKMMEKSCKEETRSERSGKDVGKIDELAEETIGPLIN
jgi:hypothetical protein